MIIMKNTIANTTRELSPIILFTYKRLDTLQKTIESLRLNTLAEESELFIYSDGAKSQSDKEGVEEVRNYLETITGFKSVKIEKAKENKGLAKSIIEGVTKTFINNDKVIVLEDDLEVSLNFLEFMNQALEFYAHNEKIISVGGYSEGVSSRGDFDIFFTKRSTSWGWATWKNRWTEIDWEVSDYKSFLKDKKAQKEFNLMGSDLSSLLTKQMSGQVSSWAVRWCYHQYKHSLLSVHPFKSKVLNLGLDSKNATHTKGVAERFQTTIDKSNKLVFNFDPNPKIDPFIIKQFVRPYSFKVRLFYFIKNIFTK